MKTIPILTLALAAMLGCSAEANEATIRKALAKRLPANFHPVDEVRPTPIPGLFEVRFGTEIRYTDAKGEFLIQGHLFDLKTQKSLTQERVDKLTAVDFAALPVKDAIVWKRGSGKRRLQCLQIRSAAIARSSNEHYRSSRM
ncbi:MAG: disulfide isomerase DsbC N-terminal domain-containing protein [Inhella sp.]